jgi:acetate kinase
LALVFHLTALRILCLNVGSSSLKWSVLDMPREAFIAGGQEPLDPTLPAAQALDLSAIVAKVGEVDAVAHRLVHGGSRFSAPSYIDDALVRALDALRPLDPTHMPFGLAGVASARAAFPHRPQVACFDTLFHATLPPTAFTYAVPRRWTDEWGVRRYGFHGLSVAFSVQRAAELLGGKPKHLLVCHLGSGSSITAVRDGQSIDTTMGFTSLEGLPMATRSGSVDPGLLLYVMREHGLTAQELDVALEERSGLLGLFGNRDLRKVLQRADLGDERAALTYGVWLTGLRRGFGAMLAALEGLDGIVFTGGIGEHQPRVRAELLASFGWCGVFLDERRNREACEDCIISSSHSKAAVLRITAREDLTMAREAASLLGASETTP